eukprot:Sspe_Gene.24413::Locus_9676_Transcript_1_1_Confidence_1.000_Length_3920::g.24413::m.24413
MKGPTDDVKHALKHRNKDGETPLHLAVYQMCVEQCQVIVQFAKRHGFLDSLLQIEDNTGQTVLRLADDIHRNTNLRTKQAMHEVQDLERSVEKCRAEKIKLRNNLLAQKKKGVGWELAFNLIQTATEYLMLHKDEKALRARIADQRMFAESQDKVALTVQAVIDILNTAA